MVTVISTFAGCGGSSLGYKMAGFTEVLAIDWDNHAEKVFTANFPDVPFWNKDITKVSSQDILEATGLKKGELDVLDGSPPCQGFSIAGKRNVTDERNDLFKHFSRLVEGLQPKVFVMENVSGMIKAPMKGKFIEILKNLKSLNYNVKVKLLNAANYSVPQSRQRLFFIGVRKDLNKEPVFPKPHGKIITVGEAFKGLEITEEEKIEADIKRFAIYKWWKLLKPGESARKYHPKGSLFNLVKIHRAKPSFTIVKTGGGGSAQIVHDTEPRTLVKKEVLRLCSFPDNFKIPGKLPQVYARLGNAVMPKQMEAIANTIREEIL